MIIYSGMATPATLTQRGAPMPLLLLYRCCGIVPITAALHIRSSAKIKLKGKLPATTLCFLWWERKDISNQGEYKVKSIMARAPVFTSGCSLKAFKTVLSDDQPCILTVPCLEESSLKNYKTPKDCNILESLIAKLRFKAN